MDRPGIFAAGDPESDRLLGSHTEFVVAGSLSVLGLREVPPELMSMSIDIDFFPLRDPTHVQEITNEVGEDSAFHEENGYFLDPISSSILVLPPGWMGRLVMHEYGHLSVYFLDVNDTAISKYARSAKNDFRWIDAGFEAGILDLDKIDARAQFNMDYPGEEDKRRVRNGIESHRAALKAGSGLRRDLLAALRSRPDARIANVIDDSYTYCGTFLYSGDDRAVQEIGNGTLVIHDSVGWEVDPEVGEFHTVVYEDGHSHIAGDHMPSRPS